VAAFPPGALHRKAERLQSKAKEAVSTPMSQSRSMNYHNFASRLSVQRLRTSSSGKVVTKPAPKKPRQTSRRPLVSAAAVLLAMCVLGMQAEAAERDGAKSSKGASGQGNLPTLLVTFTGLAVALLRVPALWKRDLDC